jgi:hypothetical protein
MRLVIHQRLIKKLCSCALPMSPEEVSGVHHACEKHTGGALQANASWHKAVGCRQCSGTGYKGRVAAHETIHISADGPARARFIKAFRSHAIELPLDLNPTNGVEFFTRISTLQVLLDHGVLDWPTVLGSLGGQE